MLNTIKIKAKIDHFKSLDYFQRKASFLFKTNSFLSIILQNYQNLM